jgi:glycosyltransferase involved in cell wall biosynthesis
VRALVWALFHFLEAIELAVELERRGIQHLHNHFANSAANVGLLAQFFLKIGWSLTLHGISEFDYPAGVLLADKIRAARHVACVSHFGRAQAMRIVEPEHWDKLFIARCGIEPESLPERRAHEGGAFRLLCVGRLSPEKGFAGLLEAVAEARARGANLHLRIAGDGPEAAPLERWIEEHHLRGAVTLLGRLSETEVLAEMAEADCFVSASLMEGLPVVIMEALGLGVPVIAPCVAGIPELVQHGVTGWLFSPGHWAELAERLLVAAADPAAGQRLGAAGQARVFEEFAVDRAVVPIAKRLLGRAEPAPARADSVAAPAAH